MIGFKRSKWRHSRSIYAGNKVVIRHSNNVRILTSVTYSSRKLGTILLHRSRFSGLIITILWEQWDWKYAKKIRTKNNVDTKNLELFLTWAILEILKTYFVVLKSWILFLWKSCLFQWYKMLKFWNGSKNKNKIKKIWARKYKFYKAYLVVLISVLSDQGRKIRPRI